MDFASFSQQLCGLAVPREQYMKLLELSQLLGQNVDVTLSMALEALANQELRNQPRRISA